MEEAVEVLLRAWTAPRVTFHGQHWHLDNIPVHPQPVQKPHPPIAIAATSDQSIAWAAEHGFREIVTWTQQGNGGMRRVNEQLGYEYRDVSITMVAPLPLEGLE
jgi:alkanesulfonate monooxygenase SsuD/methylene tetrahydromethanopterin reductase-like flavin-dependent oxidoreductase (luciferase family)